MQPAINVKNNGNTDQRWALVLSRDSRADGHFVYAVRSTGIFCRPSCPSRRPRREQVEFFASPVAAQRAGYRACRRCMPLARNAQMTKIEAACRYIDQNVETMLKLDEIAASAGLSPFHFQRLFKRTLGISPRQYQQARRAGKFKQELHKQARITDAIYEAGYGSSSRAYENGGEQLGMTPTAFRRGGEGVKIRYTITLSELGKVLVATTPRGLCAVRFGNNEVELEKELRHEFSAAEIQRDEQALQSLAEKVRKLFSQPIPAASIPLDIQGTAFQQRVWNALRTIPHGETRSYAEIAKQIGKPKAIRAVANACASNPVAVVVPCHRVVAKSGGMAGYRWGVERKEALLRTERAQG
ncbi:MAG TPA: bifunctional DNA-binding transcriptional regulator/O6-methylguanine-DNA methyltransferase Ada [Candidatus Angelobacter sp.]|nr:bifunctional DNA-binding transcriptional regulator/O6-methylguanine-DNA methyltransferase Ada [Candidatus Angelobacter sp.]